MPNVWRLLADAVVGVHFAFLAYVVLGGFLAWRWRWTIATHVLAVIWAGLIVFVKIPCPLTALQNQFRQWGGQPAFRAGFIDHYVTGRLYPSGDARLAQVLVAVLVLVSWAGYVRRRRTSGPRQQPPAGHRHLLRGRS
jgi:hypothetical protein